MWRRADVRPWILPGSGSGSSQDAEQFNSKHCDRLQLWITARWSTRRSPWKLEVRVLNPRRLYLKITDASCPLWFSATSDKRGRVLFCFFATRNIYVCWDWRGAGRVEAQTSLVLMFVRTQWLLLITRCCLFPYPVKGASTCTVQEWHLVANLAIAVPLVSAVSIRPFPITASGLWVFLEPIPAVLHGQVARGQPPGHNHSVHVLRLWKGAREPGENPHRPRK